MDAKQTRTANNSGKTVDARVPEGPSDDTSPGGTGGVSETLVQQKNFTRECPQRMIDIELHDANVLPDNQGYGSGGLLEHGLADFQKKTANVASLLKELDQFRKANASLANQLSDSKRTISRMAENEKLLARENSWLTKELSKCGEGYRRAILRKEWLTDKEDAGYVEQQPTFPHMSLLGQQQSQMADPNNTSLTHPGSTRPRRLLPVPQFPQYGQDQQATQSSSQPFSVQRSWMHPKTKQDHCFMGWVEKVAINTAKERVSLGTATEIQRQMLFTNPSMRAEALGKFCANAVKKNMPALMAMFQKDHPEFFPPTNMPSAMQLPQEHMRQTPIPNTFIAPAMQQNPFQSTAWSTGVNDTIATGTQNIPYGYAPAPPNFHEHGLGQLSDDYMPSGFDNAVGQSMFTGNLGSMDFDPPGTGDPVGGGERWQWNYNHGEHSLGPIDLAQQGHFNMQYGSNIGEDSMIPTNLAQQGYLNTQYDSNICENSMRLTDVAQQGNFNTQDGSNISADNQAGSFINFQLQLPTPSPDQPPANQPPANQPPANPYAPNLTFSESLLLNTSYTGTPSGPTVPSTPAPASVNEFMLLPPSGTYRTSDPNGIPDGHYRGTVCIACHENWWNTWCDATPQGCHNCQAVGRACRRPQCENFDGVCGDRTCKRAHRSDGFLHTVVVKTKQLKRKNKKTDHHANPPKRLAMERGGVGSA